MPAPRAIGAIVTRDDPDIVRAEELDQRVVRPERGGFVDEKVVQGARQAAGCAFEVLVVTVGPELGHGDVQVAGHLRQRITRRSEEPQECQQKP